MSSGTVLITDAPRHVSEFSRPMSLSFEGNNVVILVQDSFIAIMDSIEVAQSFSGKLIYSEYE